MDPNRQTRQKKRWKIVRILLLGAIMAVIFIASSSFIMGASLKTDSLIEGTQNSGRNGSILASTQTPAGWGDDIRLTSDLRLSYGPSIDQDSQGNNHIAWCDNRGSNYDIYYTKLDSFGNTIIDDLRITLYGSNSLFPSLKVDSQDNIHIAWHDSRSGGFEIYYTKLDNDGNTLIDDLRLTYSSEYAWNVSLEVDYQDNIHIVWKDNRDGSYFIYYKKLDNNGNTLVDELPLGSSYQYRRPSIAADGQGNIHITWSDDRDGNQEIYYTKLDNNGNTLIDDLRLTYSTWSSYPSLSTDIQGNVHISFSKSANGFYDIYYEKLDNNGNTLIDDLQLTSVSAASYLPYLGLDIHGNVHIAWHDERNGQTELYYTKLDNNGNTLIDDLRLAYSALWSFLPSLSTDIHGNVHITWVDDRDGNEEIYYKRSYYSPYGQLHGTVTAQGTAEAVVGADITVNQDDLIIDGAVTDIDGYYEIPNLPEGVYDIVVSKNGFDTITIPTVGIGNGQEVEQNVEMAAPAGDVNLSLTKLEVNQAVDTDKLVADKATYVRVYPALDGLDKVKDVTATIQAVRNGSVYYIEDATLELDVKNEYSENERIRAKNSFNFRLDKLPEGTYEFTVTLAIPDEVEDNNPDDDTIARTVDLVTLDGPKIIGVPIYYNGEGPDHDQMRKADNLMKKTFPYSDYIFEPEVGYILDSTCDPAIEDCFVTQLPNQLGVIIRDYNRNNPTQKAKVVVGFLNKDIGAEVGISYPPAGNSEDDFGVAMIKTFENDYHLTQIFSHELIHQYGLWLNPENYNLPNNSKGSFLKEEDGPFDADLGITAFRNRRHFPLFTTWGGVYRRTVMGMTTDLDEPGFGELFTSEEYWIEKLDYDYIYTDETSSKREFLKLIGNGSYIDISGIIYPDDSVQLNPWHIVTGNYTPSVPDIEGEYHIQFLDEGAVLSTHGFSLIPATGVDGVSTGPFALILDFPVQTDTVEILHNDTVIASRSVSSNPPIVTVTVPNGGENWDSQETILWTASDPDSDLLSYSVYYSSDSGVSWKILTSSFQDTNYVWDTTKAGGCTQCLVKVEANDGIHTSSDVSDGAFTVATKEPSVTIDYPADGTSFTIGEKIVLQGHGYDLEDGFLNDIQLSWESNISGVLGTGSLISLDLSLGNHIITLTGVDSDTNTIFTQISISVNDDTDNDGMPNTWENQYGLNPDHDDSNLDPDHDGAVNIDEFYFGTNPVIWNPILKQIPDRTMGEKRTLRIKPEVVSNPQSIPLEYSIDSPLFTWDGEYFIWHIGPTASGQYSFIISVNDGNEWDYETFQVTVADTCRIFIKEEWRWDCEPSVFIPIDTQQDEVYY